MSFDLLLKPTCSGCGSSKDLYGSNCKHLTLCLSCGKTMAENHARCYECGATITRLIRVGLFHLSLQFCVTICLEYSRFEFGMGSSLIQGGRKIHKFNQQMIYFSRLQKKLSTNSAELKDFYAFISCWTVNKSRNRKYPQAQILKRETYGSTVFVFFPFSTCHALARDPIILS